MFETSMTLKCWLHNQSLPKQRACAHSGKKYTKICTGGEENSDLLVLSSSACGQNEMKVKGVKYTVWLSETTHEHCFAPTAKV